jgi:hypothetical protein
MHTTQAILRPAILAARKSGSKATQPAGARPQTPSLHRWVAESTAETASRTTLVFLILAMAGLVGLGIAFVFPW